MAGGRRGAAAEIGGVPAGSLELEAGGGDLLLETWLAARQAYCQHRVGYLLQHILGKTAFIAAVGVNRHRELRKNRQNPEL